MLILDFAGLGQVSIGHLRHYDAIGLLTPTAQTRPPGTATTPPSIC